MISLNIDEVVKNKKNTKRNKEGPDYEIHKDGEKAFAANPSIFTNPSIQQPEMMGKLRLSSIDPRSKINK